MKHSINNAIDVCHSASYNAGWWVDKDGYELTEEEI